MRSPAGKGQQLPRAARGTKPDESRQPSGSGLRGGPKEAHAHVPLCPPMAPPHASAPPPPEVPPTPSPPPRTPQVHPKPCPRREPHPTAKAPFARSPTRPAPERLPLLQTLGALSQLSQQVAGPRAGPGRPTHPVSRSPAATRMQGPRGVHGTPAPQAPSCAGTGSLCRCPGATATRQVHWVAGQNSSPSGGRRGSRPNEVQGPQTRPVTGTHSCHGVLVGASVAWPLSPSRGSNSLRVSPAVDVGPE